MITLDPEFVGSLAPPPKLTTAVDDKSELPFARLPRLERLRVQGKADETEEGDEAEPGVINGDENEDSKGRPSKAEKEKNKMRGKNKSLKRYLRKQRKNVIDPKAVGILNIDSLQMAQCSLLQVAVRAKLEKQREERKKAIAIARGEAEPRKPSALDRFRRL